MAEATVSDGYVGALHVQYTDGSVSGLTADVAFNVQVDGMETKVSKNVDAWGLLSANQKNVFNTLMGEIVESAEE